MVITVREPPTRRHHDHQVERGGYRRPVELRACARVRAEEVVGVRVMARKVHVAPSGSPQGWGLGRRLDDTRLA